MVFMNKDNISEDWGYFIDIEEYENKIDTLEKQLDTNKEITNNITNLEYYYNYLKKNRINISLRTNMLIKISSTSLATILLTYLILCVI